MKKINAIILGIIMALFSSGCSDNSNSGQSGALSSNSTDSSDSISHRTEESGSALVQTSSSSSAEATDSAQSTDKTRVKVTINDGTVVYAEINNTTTAKAFIELLPFQVDGYRSSDDICCAVTEKLPNDPSEDEEWNIGEIGWFGGWFTILCDNEENFAGQKRAIIGKIEDEYISTVVNLNGNMHFTVELADTAAQESGENVSSSSATTSSSSATTSSSTTTSSSSSIKEENPVAENIMYIKANGTTFTAKLADNSSAKALVELLKKGDITVNAHDYGNFEKVGSLPQSLPRNDEQITTGAGDLILYQGDQFVFYYDTNSWSFTRLGKVEGYTTAQLKEILGGGNVDLVLSLNK